MSSFRFLGVTAVLSALLATPVSAWEAISEPDAAASLNPSFSIYSDSYSGLASSRAMASQAVRADTSRLRMSVRMHRVHRAAKRY